MTMPGSPCPSSTNSSLSDSEVSNDSGFESTVAGNLPPDYMDLDEFLVATGVKLDVSKSAFQTKVVQKKIGRNVEQEPSKESTSKTLPEVQTYQNNVENGDNTNAISEAKKESPKTKNNSKTKSSSCKEAEQEYNYSYNPLPMKRKAQRQFVSDTEKDDKYWKRRIRNNEAARRSRDMRRQREIEISLQCKELEKENARLRKELQKLKDKANKLEKQLSEK